MFYLRPLSLCTHFIAQLNGALSKLKGGQLSSSQKLMLSICLTGIIVTNSVCWKKFERASLGKFCANGLSKMFRRSKIAWDKLLMVSVLNIFEQYKITEGVLSLDGTDNPRSKNTSKIAKVHKIKDKKSGGFIKGQELTILVLITGKITVPVGFEFYEPDPTYSEWKRNEKALRKKVCQKKTGQEHLPKIIYIRLW